MIPISLDEIAGTCAGGPSNQCSFAMASQSAHQCASSAAYQGSSQLAMVMIYVVIGGYTRRGGGK